MVLVKRPYYKEDREIETEFGTRELSRAMVQRLIAKPSLVRGHVTPLQFETLCAKVSRITDTLSIHESILSDLQEQIQNIEQSQDRDREVTAKIDAASIENTKHLRALFELPDIVGEVNEDVLANMKGMLKGKVKGKIDSLELLRMIRGG